MAAQNMKLFDKLFNRFSQTSGLQQPVNKAGRAKAPRIKPPEGKLPSDASQGTILKYLRRKQGMNQKQFAAMFRITVRELSEMENDRRMLYRFMQPKLYEMIGNEPIVFKAVSREQLDRLG